MKFCVDAKQNPIIRGTKHLFNDFYEVREKYGYAEHINGRKRDRQDESVGTRF